MAHPAEQTARSPHSDLCEPSRNGEPVSNGELVNSLLVGYVEDRAKMR